MSKYIPANRSQAGFTLVELAIVMIIIGLLIGGVLKGQELISNSQVTATIAQVKGTTAATTTFEDMYNGLPGDINGARISGCTGVCAPAVTAITNNNVINSAFTAAPIVEGIAYFQQLGAADLLTGIDTSAASTATWNSRFPSGKLSGTGLHVDSITGLAAELPNMMAGGPAPNAGLYLALHGTQNGAVAATGVITPTRAFQMDTKIDDGLPQTGSVRGAGAATCQVGTAYNQAVNTALCNLYIRIR